jgi:O-antigen/teichoic acid export membrane protein
MKPDHSAKHILRSTGIVGGASVANILIGLVRTKVAALVLGPAGIGLIGLAHGLITMVAAFASFGLGNVGTRQIAAAGDDPAAISAARRATAIAAAALAAVGALVLFLLREQAALWVFQDRSWAANVGWLALGVALLIGSIAQNSMLTGLRRIGDLARVSVTSALLTTALGVAALLAWRQDALLFYVLVSPLVTFLVGAWFVARIPRLSTHRPRIAELTPHWRALARLGLAFTLGAAANTAGQLAVRALVQRELGPVALGHYQAVWMISTNYIVFLLAALATDYYPRLAAAIGDPEAARRTVNQQAEVVLLLSGPVLVGTVAFAPWLVPLLFSSKFLPAVEILRWQILGDFMKIVSATLGFLLLAGGHGRAYVAVEVVACTVFVGVTALALKWLGPIAPGVAYFAMYSIYAVLVLVLARRSIAFVPTARTVEAFLAVAGALIITVLCATFSPLAGALAGIALGAAIAALVAVRLRHALPERLATALGTVRRPK